MGLEDRVGSFTSSFQPGCAFATCWFVTTGLEALCLFIPQQDSKDWYICSRLVHLIRCSCVSTSQLK